MFPNKEQKAIITYFTNDSIDKRIISVEAPPGTGKTYTAVSTCINYIEYQLNKNNKYKKKALILTFSKNARAQIEKQLDALSIDKVGIENLIEITNFHSFFQRYVWAYSKYLGLVEDLIIVSPKQRKDLLKENLKFIEEYTGDNYQYSWVDSLLEGGFYPLTSEENIRPSVEKLLSYKHDIISMIKDINKNGYIGFSDIAYYMKELLYKSPSLLKVIQSKYDLIILDEYQDISDLQDDIIKKIIGKEIKAIFFSDNKQMIYGWRGASQNRIIELFDVYENEILSMELVDSMRFKDKQDIKNLIDFVRKETYDLKQYKSSNNIEYIQINVEDKNLYRKKSKNIMYSKLLYKIINNLTKRRKEGRKSIGILCRSNEQVEYLNKKLREEFSIYTQLINNNEEEHNLVCDLIELSGKSSNDLSLDDLSKNITKYIFSVIYDDKIGSIKRSEQDTITFSNYKNVRKPILKEIKSFIMEAHEKGEYIDGVYNCITSINNSELSINHGNMTLLKKIINVRNINRGRITDLFLQHQYFKAFKDLRGVYLLNVHQSKGREFDVVYIVDRETINKDKNLLYVGVSRVKEKLVFFDWV